MLITCSLCGKKGRPHQFDVVDFGEAIPSRFNLVCPSCDNDVFIIEAKFKCSSCDWVGVPETTKVKSDPHHQCRKCGDTKLTVI